MQKLIFSFLLILSATTALPAQSLRAYERAGDAALRQKDYAAAIANYQTVLQRKPDNPEVLWKYAECAMRFNAYPEAERALRTMTNSKKAPNYPDLQLLLGEALLRQGRYAEAEQQLLAFFRKKKARAKSAGAPNAWQKAQPGPESTRSPAPRCNRPAKTSTAPTATLRQACATTPSTFPLTALRR